MITLRQKTIHEVPLGIHRVKILLYFVRILGKNVRGMDFKYWLVFRIKSKSRQVVLTAFLIRVCIDPGQINYC